MVSSHNYTDPQRFLPERWTTDKSEDDASLSNTGTAATAGASAGDSKSSAISHYAWYNGAVMSGITLNNA